MGIGRCGELFLDLPEEQTLKQNENYTSTFRTLNTVTNNSGSLIGERFESLLPYLLMTDLLNYAHTFEKTILSQYTLVYNLCISHVGVGTQLC